MKVHLHHTSLSSCLILHLNNAPCVFFSEEDEEHGEGGETMLFNKAEHCQPEVTFFQRKKFCILFLPEH